MMRNKMLLFAMAMASINNDGLYKRIRETQTQKFSKTKHPKKQYGQKFEYPDGIIVFAINKKNADRKYKKIIIANEN